MIACIVISYLVVTLGALKGAAVFYRADVVECRLHRESPPKRYKYIAIAIGWPLLWALVPLIVFLVGAVSMAEDSNASP